MFTDIDSIDKLSPNLIIHFTPNKKCRHEIFLIMKVITGELRH